jgi:hypothetical protein
MKPQRIMPALQWAWQAAHHRVSAASVDLKNVTNERPATDAAVTARDQETKTEAILGVIRWSEYLRRV